MVSKHVFGPIVILIRILPVLLSMPERGDLCAPVGVPEQGISINYVQHINATTREARCCKPTLCYAGNEVVYCSMYNSSSTSCRKCEVGYFSTDTQMSYMNPMCRPWKKCNPKLGLVVGKQGTTTEDRTCRCNVAEGYYTSIWDECTYKKNKCDEDHELDVKSGKCERCRPGSEQLVRGYGPCKLCPVNYHKQVEGDKCLPCPPGTFKPDEGSGVCLTCSELIRKNIYTPECEGSTGDPTPMAVKPEEESGISVGMAAGLGAFALVVLIVIIIVAVICARRRRKEPTKQPVSPAKKVSRSPVHAAQTYTPVPDNTSHSSAEDAMDSFKVKDQNQHNTVLENINESKIPHSPASDGLPNEGYDDQLQAIPNGGTRIPNGVAGQPNGVAGQPNGVAGQPNGVARQPNGVAGQPNGVARQPNGVAGQHYPGVRDHMPPGGSNVINIYGAPNCPIIVGDHGTLHNQTLGSTPPKPSYISNQHQGSAAYQNGQPRRPPDTDGPQGMEYYEDPADRIAAEYGSGTPC